MNIDERLKYAENRRDESITNGTSYDCAYWNGYLDVLKAVKDYRKASEVAREIFEDIFYHTHYEHGRLIIEHSTLLALQKKYTGDWE